MWLVVVEKDIREREMVMTSGDERGLISLKRRSLRMRDRKVEVM